MISYLQGKIIDSKNSEITILTSGGVGYIVFVTPTAMDSYKIGQEVSILIYMSVSENALNLYGFSNNEEKVLFKHLLSVSGIGPKSALHLLSLGTVQEIQSAIINGDVDYLTKVSGVGKRTAERIVVELKTKIGDLEIMTGENTNGENLSDVIDGLVTMGYSVQQAREAIKKINTDGKSSEQLLREILQSIR